MIATRDTLRNSRGMSGATLLCQHLNRASTRTIAVSATASSATASATTVCHRHDHHRGSRTPFPANLSTAACAPLPSLPSSRGGNKSNATTKAEADVGKVPFSPGGRQAGTVTNAGGAAPLSGAKRAVSSKSSLLTPAGAALMGTRGGQAPATRVDAVVIGAGQAGLSVAYHLQRAGGLRFATLDANKEPGGAWKYRWPSLELFSTRKWSSLPGYPMFANGACEDGYPTTGEMAMYMEEYESVMKLNVVRPVTVTGVSRTTMGTFLVNTDCLLGGNAARWEARTVISAAGTHSSPIWPRLPGLETFTGKQIHSSQYRCAEDFRGARVAVVGAGNSGAQILAEVSQPGVASSTLWSTKEEPSFLPNDLSGKEIFDTVATLRQKQGFVRAEDIPSLNSVIMQPGVVEASARGVYEDYVPAFTRLTRTGVEWDASADGSRPAGHADVDVIIWCTGYHSNTSHLSRLGLVKRDSTVAMQGGDMGESDVPGVFAVGYGNWAGVGSGSIPGSTVYAKRAAMAAVQHLRGGNTYDASRVAVEAAYARPSFPLNGSPPMNAPSRSIWPTSRRGAAGGGRTPSEVAQEAVAGTTGTSPRGSRHAQTPSSSSSGDGDREGAGEQRHIAIAA